MTHTRASRQLMRKGMLWSVALLIICTITTVRANAQTFTNLWKFSNGDGANPQGTLVLGSDGNFYGTTSNGGNLNDCGLHGCGTIFRITPHGKLQDIYQFTGGADGAEPRAGLIQVNGVLYGATSYGGNIDTEQGTIFSINEDGSNFSVLYTFSGGADGGQPVARLLLGKDGNLYGTTSQGGQNSNCFNGCGTIFSIAPDGSNFTTLYQFYGGNQVYPGPTDGNAPEAGLIQDSSGNFYGTTHSGGALCNPDLTCGTVFMFQLPGTLTTLHSFNGTTDGSSLDAPLVLGRNGTLYGTAQAGGNLNCGINTAQAGCGTIFSVNVNGNEFNVVWTFQGSQNLPSPDGAQPFGELLFGTDGNLYGTTGYGGAVGGSCISEAGCGTIFSLAPTGGKPTILHSFAITDGDLPTGGLIESSGTFYGTTSDGGNSGCTVTTRCGTVFSLAVSSQGKTSTTTTAMVTPSSIEQGAPGGVTLSATVRPASGSGTPTGTITFFNQTTQLSQQSLSAGMASISYDTSVLAGGSYSIKAVYSGDANYAASTSTAATLSVVDFQISATPTTVTVSAPGQTGSTNLTITPLGGFDQNLTFACSGLPLGANCTFGNSANGATLSISTAACSAASAQDRRGSKLVYAMLLPGLLGFVPAGARKRSMRGVRLLVFLAALGLVSMCIGCSAGLGNLGNLSRGGSCKGGTPTGTSTVAVMATAGSHSHSTTITLNVQ